jgi:CheY-like chemotaxis protein/PAS domain-containing protein
MTDPDLADVLFRQSADGLLLIDALTGQVRDANPSAERLTEFGRAELLEMSLRSLLRHEQPWHDWTLATAKDAAQVHEGFSIRTRRPDGWLPIRLEMTPVPHEGGPDRLLLRLGDDRADLALRRRAERAEADLRRVLDNAGECHWSAHVASGGWTYRALSPAVERLTGRAAGAFLDSPEAWADAVVAADRPGWRAFRDRLALGQPGSLDYRILHADGRTIRVRETAHVVLTEDGLTMHGVLAEVVDAKDAPASGGEKVDCLMGTISHDFNNLIAGILGNVALANLDPSPENTAASLERIESIADRAADLCRRLSTCAGQIPRNGTTPDPTSAIRLAVAELAASRPDVAVEVEVEADLPPLAVDPVALTRAVEELLRNAFQAGAGRVAVRLGSRLPEATSPEVFAHPLSGPPSAGVHLQVWDDGEGISGAARLRLGEPFSTTRPGQRGLGVATVLGIARASRGAFRIHSREGAGTLAVLSFPAARPVASRVPAASSAAGPTAPLVLLVDDEQAIVDVASRLLASAGCRVLTARNGPEALEQYGRHAAEIRLAVLDLNLPRMGGGDVAAELRRLDARLPVVLMSGHHDLEDRPELAGLGLAGCLQKPFRLPELLALLERILGLPAKG